MTPNASPQKSAHLTARVTWVHHWTDTLFSFKVQRPTSLRFRSGEFILLGLQDDPKPLLRAYSIASPCHADELEFLSIKAPGGVLTSRLQKIEPGHEIVLGKKPTGTLVLDALKPGKRLFLVSTGTGLAPFLSLARDPEAFERFEQIIVTHTVRTVDELAYRALFEHDIHQDELVGEDARARLVYYPTVTREPFQRSGRMTTRVRGGEFFADLQLEEAQFDSASDRVMLCGSLTMIKEMASILDSHGLREGATNHPGDYVLERAFVG